MKKANWTLPKVRTPYEQLITTYRRTLHIGSEGAVRRAQVKGWNLTFYRGNLPLCIILHNEHTTPSMYVFTHGILEFRNRGGGMRHAWTCEMVHVEVVLHKSTSRKQNPNRSEL